VTGERVVRVTETTTTTSVVKKGGLHGIIHPKEKTTVDVSTETSQQVFGGEKADQEALKAFMAAKEAGHHLPADHPITLLVKEKYPEVFAGNNMQAAATP